MIRVAEISKWSKNWLRSVVNSCGPGLDSISPQERRESPVPVWRVEEAKVPKEGRDRQETGCRGPGLG